MVPDSDNNNCTVLSCLPGYEFNEFGSCQPCPFGTFSKSRGEACQPLTCPEGTRPPNSAATGVVDCLPPPLEKFLLWFVVGTILSVILIKMINVKYYPIANTQFVPLLGLQILDSVSDVVFIVSLSYEVPGSKQAGLLIPAVFFLVLPLALNFANMMRIFKKLLKNDLKFRSWCQVYKASALFCFGFLGMLNSELSALSSSRLFGLDFLNAPLDERHVLRLRQYGIITNVFEDLPQLIIQFVVVFSDKGSPIAQVFLSLPLPGSIFFFFCLYMVLFCLCSLSTIVKETTDSTTSVVPLLFVLAVFYRIVFTRTSLRDHGESYHVWTEELLSR